MCYDSLNNLDNPHHLIEISPNLGSERLFALVGYYVSLPALSMAFEDEVISAVLQVQASTPSLNRAKILKQIKAENGWELTGGQLKNIMNSEEFRMAQDEASQNIPASKDLSPHIPSSPATLTASKDPSQNIPPQPLTSEQKMITETLENAINNYAPAINTFPVADNNLALVTLYNSIQAYPIFPRSILEHDPLADGDDKSDLPAPTIPPNAFAAQRKYQDTSTRMLIIYGRKYNYGISPNSNQGIYYMSLFLKHIDKQFHHATQKEKEEVLPDTAVIRALWEYYEASAKAAGVARADVGRQFEAEWGINMHQYLPTRTSKVPEIQQLIERWDGRRAEIFKQNLLPIYQTSLAMGITTLPVDSSGKIIWKEEVHGQFVIDVVKIDKATGKECGRV